MQPRSRSRTSASSFTSGRNSNHARHGVRFRTSHWRTAECWVRSLLRETCTGESSCSLKQHKTARLTGQSKSINRFIAKLVGFYPSDPIDAAHVDELVDGLADLFPTAMKAGVGLDTTAKEAARLASCTDGVCNLVSAWQILQAYVVRYPNAHVQVASFCCQVRWPL